jgi:protease I
VTVAGLTTEPVQGKNGLEATADVEVDAISADAVDAVVVPGGWAPDKLRRYDAVKDLVAKAYHQGKVVGLICHAGLVGISAGIVDGKRATGSLGIKDDLVNAGATWVDEPAFRDGNLVWAAWCPTSQRSAASSSPRSRQEASPADAGRGGCACLGQEGAGLR